MPLRYMVRVVLWWAISAMALAGCASQGRRAAPVLSPDSHSNNTCESPADHQWLRCRARWDSFEFQGRAAIRHGDEAGSVNLTWRQEGAFYDIELRVPITGQIFRLSGDGQTAMLDGVREETLMDVSPEHLLERETGWHLPVTAMRDWARGMPHTASTIVQWTETMGEGAWPLAMQEGAWRIGYGDPDESSGMPSRIQIESQTVKVKMLIDRWKRLP